MFFFFLFRESLLGRERNVYVRSPRMISRATTTTTTIRCKLLLRSARYCDIATPSRSNSTLVYGERSNDLGKRTRSTPIDPGVAIKARWKRRRRRRIKIRKARRKRDRARGAIKERER